MPELPEVETVVRILNGFVPSKTIQDITVIRDKNILTPVKEFKEALIGETFLPTSRAGKFIVFHLTNNKVIVSHLRMEGKYFESRNDVLPEKHDIVIFHFTDGTALRYNDVRKFGVIELKTEDNYLTTLPLSKLGKEPWDLTPKELHEGLQKKKGPIKEALLDQTLIAGLGNIYDDEVLFATGINPKTNACDITLKQSEKILIESRRILEEAIEAGGSTIRSYHPKEGMDGRMQNELLAYGHANEPCPKCGFPMRKIFIGGRGTTYCPICQKYENHPLIVGVTGPIGSGKSEVAKYLSKKGFFVCDADKIVHDLYKDEEIVKTLTKMFGDVTSSGKFDKKKLLAIVSENPKKKKELENFIHPLVFQNIFDTIEKGHHKKILLDVPLLIGSPLEEMCDLIIYRDTSDEIRLERLKERGVDVSKFIELNKSFPKAKAKRAAGLLLNGDGSLSDLYTKLDSIF